jgi:glycosyltransferase involved in cell wall biosynthesis
MLLPVETDPTAGPLPADQTSPAAPALRILMLAQFYPPIIGGEERMVQDMSQELASRGHSVAVATLWHAGLAEFELDGPVRVYRVRSLVERASWLFKESGRRHAPPWPDPGIALGLRKVIRQERPQIVHAHNWIGHSFIPLKPWSRARLVVSLHDYSLVCAKKRMIYRGQACDGPGLVKCLTCAADHYGVAKGVPTAVATAVARWEQPAVDMFLPVSQAVAVQCKLEQRGAKYQVIPNFLPSEAPGRTVDTAPYLAQLPPGDFLLFVGDLSVDKGIQVLLNAYAAIPQAPPLVLIGRPTAGTPAEMPPNVMPLGPWPHEAVLEAWRRCRIALVPSIWSEPFGLVALEAMAAGRPIIASRTGGLVDMIVDGESGMLVSPGDVVALRAAIVKLVASPDFCRRLGLAGQHRAGEFGAAVVLPRLEQVYRNLCTVSSRPTTPVLASGRDS